MCTKYPASSVFTLYAVALLPHSIADHTTEQFRNVGESFVANSQTHIYAFFLFITYFRIIGMAIKYPRK